MAEAVIEGIDVSHYQGTIDWSKVAGAGKTFAFIKASDGTVGADPTFAYNWSRARQAGLRRGAYHFFRPITDALQQAQHFLRQLGDDHGELPPVLDFELLGPLPGSLSYDYLRRPGMARARADELGLNVNDRYLEMLHRKYLDEDELVPEELLQDFVRGCCPDITVEMAYGYLRKIRQFVADEHIAYDCSSIPQLAV